MNRPPPEVGAWCNAPAHAVAAPSRPRSVQAAGFRRARRPRTLLARTADAPDQHGRQPLARRPLHARAVEDAGGPKGGAGEGSSGRTT